MRSRPSTDVDRFELSTFDWRQRRREIQECDKTDDESRVRLQLCLSGQRAATIRSVAALPRCAAKNSRVRAQEVESASGL